MKYEIEVDVPSDSAGFFESCLVKRVIAQLRVTLGIGILVRPLPTKVEKDIATDAEKKAVLDMERVRHGFVERMGMNFAKEMNEANKKQAEVVTPFHREGFTPVAFYYSLRRWFENGGRKFWGRHANGETLLCEAIAIDGSSVWGIRARIIDPLYDGRVYIFCIHSRTSNNRPHGVLAVETLKSETITPGVLEKLPAEPVTYSVSPAFNTDRLLRERQGVVEYAKAEQKAVVEPWKCPEGFVEVDGNVLAVKHLLKYGASQVYVRLKSMENPALCTLVSNLVGLGEVLLVRWPNQDQGAPGICSMQEGGQVVAVLVPPLDQTVDYAKALRLSLRILNDPSKKLWCFTRHTWYPGGDRVPLPMKIGGFQLEKMQLLVAGGYYPANMFYGLHLSESPNI